MREFQSFPQLILIRLNQKKAKSIVTLCFRYYIYFVLYSISVLMNLRYNSLDLRAVIIILFKG